MPKMNQNATPYEPCRRGPRSSRWRQTARGSSSDITRMLNPPLPVATSSQAQISSHHTLGTVFPTVIASQTQQTQDAIIANVIPYHNYQVPSLTNISNQNQGFVHGKLSRGQVNSILLANQYEPWNPTEATALLLANLKKAQDELVIRPTGGAIGASVLFPASSAPPFTVRNGLPLIYNSEKESVKWEHAPLFEFQRVSGPQRSSQQRTRMASDEWNYTTVRLPVVTIAPSLVDRAVDNVRRGTPTAADAYLYQLQLLPTDLSEEFDR